MTEPTHDPTLREPITVRRLRGTASVVALVMLAFAACCQVAGAVLAGRIAQLPTLVMVGWLAAAVVSMALFDTMGQFVWASVVDRAAGKLRRDLTKAVFAQPLSALADQAVGEILDRIDDDTQEVNTLLRVQVWMLLRTLISAVPMWVVAGVTWWPAWLLFPAAGAISWLAMRGLLPEIAPLKVAEEQAWTDHAAVLEESIAGRDDLRTSLGQPFAVRRLVELSRIVHERFLAVVTVQRTLALRTGLVLHALLATVVVLGVVLGVRQALDISSLVTVFLVTATFVGLLAHVAEQLPDVQAGLGAILRLRGLLDAQQEPRSDGELPDGPIDIDFRHVSFRYGEGTFGLRDVSAQVPAGSTLALVGRTGSGKSTLASLISRATEPDPGQVFLGGVDVTTLNLEQLRSSLGVVTQKTEIIAGTLAQNVSLFTAMPDERIKNVLDQLGLGDWAESLPNGIHTVLGPAGITLSAGEEQLIAFARVLARDVRVVILDEATARMDPQTEARVVAASQRLLAGRTGVLIAHRLSTIERADFVMVLSDGQVAQFGPRRELAQGPGHFAQLLRAANGGVAGQPTERAPEGAEPASADEVHSTRVSEAATNAHRRRETVARAEPEAPPQTSLTKAVWKALRVRPQWCLAAVGLFLLFSVTGAAGPLTGYAWGQTVQAVRDGHEVTLPLVVTVLSVLVGPVALAGTFRRYPRWWIEILLRVRLNVLIGQTNQRHRSTTPAGEVVARAMDADRFVRYCDRWVDVVNGLIVVAVTAVAAGSPLAGLVLLIIMLASAVASAAGRPIAGRSAAVASQARATFGRVLVSALEGIRTVKLSGRSGELTDHLASIDAPRVEASVREHRISAILSGVPVLMIQLGIVAAWAGVALDVWNLATALLVANAAAGFDWYGRVAGAVVTEAPGTRAWLDATVNFADGRELTREPAQVNLLEGKAPTPPEPTRVALKELSLREVTVTYEDGTVGVGGVNLDVARGELVLLLGSVGAGKTSLLRAVVALAPFSGVIRWNGEEIADPQSFLRPNNVAFVGQTPRVFSGTFRDNIALDFTRGLAAAVDAARLEHDISVAGGADAMVGHRGVRLSGGQVQRLALARALAADSELLVADDVSSALDAATELELWALLRERGATVLGSSAKAAALRQADRVVVLDAGRIVDTGPWDVLQERWSHLAG